MKKETVSSRTPITKSLPVIKIGTDFHRITSEAISSLERTNTVFQRNGVLVRCLRVKSAEAKAHRPLDSLVIRQMSAPTLVEVFSATAHYIQYIKTRDEWINSPAPDKVVRAALDRGEYKNIRALTGLAESPFIAPEGTICSKQGFYKSCGYFLDPTVQITQIPDNPTLEDAQNSLTKLRELFVDFPFVSESSEMVAIAAILTLLSKPFIDSDVPIFTVDAASAATGKTTLCDVIALIATGRTVPKLTFPRKPEELEKIIGSIALDGSQLICFDNVATSFGGDALNKAVTGGGSVKLRILGKSETPELYWNAVVLANGNNLAINGDTVTRVLPCRLESTLERPEQRNDFKHSDIVGWCLNNRSGFVTAVLTMIRAWIVAGKPQIQCAGLRRFSQWSKIIPSVICYAGGVDPTSGSYDLVNEGDGDERGLHIELIEVLDEIFMGGFTARKVYERSNGNQQLDAAVKELVWESPNPRKIGKLLRRLKGKVINGKIIVATGKTDRNIIWNIVKPSGGPEKVSEPEGISEPEENMSLDF